MAYSSVGVDIAKHKFDVALLHEGKYKTKQFPNTPEGFLAFRAWLPPTPWVCLEATGNYSEALSLFLVEQQIPVSVVNPARIAAFARTELARAKTDKGDAKLIARFCHEKRDSLLPFTPPPANVRALQALVRRLDNLMEMQQMERNRLEVASPIVAPSLHKTLDTLTDQIADIQQAIRRHIDDDPDLRRRRDLLETIPGIGHASAAAMLGLLGDLSRFTQAKQAVAFAGLCPRPRESGMGVGKTRLSKTGDALLRKVLYMPALSAARHNPVIRAFCQRLKANGKQGKAVICAAMRKLLHLAFGVLRSGRPFDPLFAQKSLAG